MRKTVILFVLALVLALAMSALVLVVGARAHEGYEWIMNGPYYAKSGVHCCGSDCRRLTTEEIASVRHVGDRWVFAGAEFREEERGLYRSEDGDWWMCGGTGVPPRCLFPPGEGT